MIGYRMSIFSLRYDKFVWVGGLHLLVDGRLQDTHGVKGCEEEDEGHGDNEDVLEDLPLQDLLLLHPKAFKVHGLRRGGCGLSWDARRGICRGRDVKGEYSLPNEYCEVIH